MKTNSGTYNIYFDKNIKAVVMEWAGYTTSEGFREGTELMLNTLIKNNCESVLANIKDMTLIGAEDQQWLDKLFLPRATKFGFKKIAIVKPSSYFNQVAVESISEKIDREVLTVNHFDNLEGATLWLKPSSKSSETHIN